MKPIKINRRPYAAKRYAGLTLIEMVAVLVILAILATVAVEMVEPRVDQKRFETTQQAIQNVDNAIVAETKNERGASSYTGFVADMGRLPQARPDVSGTVLTLSELWMNPGVAPFAVRPANNAEGGVSVGQEDAEVFVACGWNGPYVRLPVGADTLRDGWGVPLVTDGISYSHLRSRDPATGEEVDVTQEDDPVYGVRSLGRNNILDPNDSGYDRDLPQTLQITDGRIDGVVQGNVTVNESAPTTESILVQLYGPDSSTGQVHVDRIGPTVGLDSYMFDSTYDVKVGVHAIRAYIDRNQDGQIDAGDARSQVVYFTVRPGINTVPDLNIDIATYP